MIQHPLISLTEDKTLLGSIAEEYGTPLYIYSGNRIKNNIDRLSTALNKHLKKNQIYFAVKANSNPHLISYMRSIYPDLGCDCSSPTVTIGRNPTISAPKVEAQRLVSR